MSHAIAGYEAFAKHHADLGLPPHPSWESLPDVARGAWEQAAEAILADATEPVTKGDPAPTPVETPST